MTDRRHYLGYLMDSARWDAVEMRDGDIVVSTPSKCGTTWMQMCCLVLVHGPSLPRPLSELAPWLDQLLRPIDDVARSLAAQTHRRVIKTHTPLDGLPNDARVSYVVVGRDPRDAALSFVDHRSNMNPEVAQRLRGAVVAGGAASSAMQPVPRPTDPVEQFDLFVADDVPPEQFRGGLNLLVHHLRLAWDRRDEPNVNLFHYADMRRDLSHELHRLADALDIGVTESAWPALVSAATFDSMRARADDLAPNAGVGLWHANDAFFAEGRMGGWRDVIPSESLARYDARVRELAAGDDDFLAWLHDGSAP